MRYSIACSFIVECILGESLYQPPYPRGETLSDEERPSEDTIPTGADSMRDEAGECVFDKSESDLSEDRAESMGV